MVFERSGAGHHVDGVEEELGRNARFFLIPAEAEEADARDDDDRRVRVAQLRRIGRRKRVVVAAYIVPIGRHLRRGWRPSGLRCCPQPDPSRRRAGRCACEGSDRGSSCRGGSGRCPSGTGENPATSSASAKCAMTRRVDDSSRAAPAEFARPCRGGSRAGWCATPPKTRPVAGPVLVDELLPSDRWCGCCSGSTRAAWRPT